MANDMYTFNLVANIDESKSNAEIQKYIDEIKSKVALDEKSKIKIHVTPIMENVPDPNKAGEYLKNSAGEYIKVQKDLTTVTAQYTNQMGQSVTEVGKFKVAEDGATETLKKSNTYVSQAAGAQRNLVTEISAVIRRTLESAATLGVLYGALNQIRQGIEYVKDLDKELTNVQVVTGMSQESVEDLAMGYNGLAKEMGVTTLEVAKGSLEWIRQGKTAQQASELVKSSMILSKLGNIEAGQSTEYLTSMLNGFKLEAKDSIGVIDKIVSLDNAFATSSSEISSALQRSSVSAQQAGVTFEELASMITVVSDVSRRAPESIGEAFKTMFARYQDILQGGVDEEGMGINNVGKALERVGINIRDAEGGFRDFSDVLDELYPKWGSLNEIEQANILKSMAGTRQRESLLILLENQEKYEKGLEVQLNSTGKALDRYDEYLTGVEASQNRFNASWERLAQNSISSGVISSFYDSLSGIVGFIDTIGGLPTILTLTAIGLTIAYTGTLTFAGALGILEGALLAVEATMMAMNPAAWALLAVGAIVMIVNSIETAEEKLIRLNSEIEDHNNNISKLRDSAKSISELSSKYEELNKIYKETGKMSQEFLDVQNQLKELIPELSGNFDEYGNFILDANNDMKNLNQSTIEQIDLEKKLRQSKLDEKADAQAKNLLELQKDKIRTSAKGGSLYSESEKIQINLDWSNALKESKTAFNEMSEEGKQAFISSLMESGAQGEEIVKIFTQEINKELANQEIELFGTPEAIQEKAKEDGQLAYESFSATVDGLVSSSESVSSLIEKSMSEGLSLSDVASIPEEYLSALVVEGDAIKLNISLIKEKQLADAEMAYQAIVSAQARGEATATEVAIIGANYNQLLTQSQETFGQFGQTAWGYDELLWKIANDAVQAGFTFTDMEGNALKSAESIQSYLASSPAAFSNFVNQVASATGRTVSQVTNIINQMINQTVAKLNSLGGMSGGLSPDERDELNSSGLNLNAGVDTSPSLFDGFDFSGGGSYSGGGGSSGGGGDGSSGNNDTNDEASRLREIEKEIEKARNDATKSLKNQLKIYKQMVDERKKLLDTMKEERTYQQDLEDKQDNVADIQNQISELSLDDSAEAQAQVLALQEQLADAQQELGNLEFEHGIDQQQTALDDELSRVESLVENAITAIEGIDASSLESFMTQLSAILAGLGSSVPTFHSGIDAGFVGGNSESKENEQFAKLLKGELVINPEQMKNFMNKTLPNIMGGVPSISPSNMGMEIGQLMNFNISGNLDKSVIPSIEKIAEKVIKKLNDAVLIRGTKRTSNLFSQ